MSTQDNHCKVPLASIFGKRLDLAFDGGILTSDSGVLLLREVEAKTGILSRIIEAIKDRRHPSYVAHSVADLVKQRVFQIACGYEDANDCDALCSDPGFKAACGRLPLQGEDLSSQPTMSRFENQMSRSDLYRIARAFVDAFIASYKKPPRAIILDIDDTQDTVYGTQQLALFNGYFNAYAYQPLHIYEGQSGKLITTILRPGVRPDGIQVVAIVKRLVAYLREAWPHVAIFLRGDAHFSSPQVQDFCETQGLYFIVGQTANTRLLDLAKPLMEKAKSLYAHTNKPVRLFTSFYYQAQTWACARRIICKAEITTRGQNTRFVVTNLESSRASFIYQNVYCARGQMENFIKNHKTFLHSDRTSCHAFGANQFRLFLHSAAYVLLHTLAHIGLQGTTWINAQVNTLQNRFLKVAGRVCELKTKITFHLPMSFPLPHLFDKILCNLAKAVP